MLCGTYLHYKSFLSLAKVISLTPDKKKKITQKNKYGKVLSGQAPADKYLMELRAHLRYL